MLKNVQKHLRLQSRLAVPAAILVSFESSKLCLFAPPSLRTTDTLESGKILKIANIIIRTGLTKMQVCKCRQCFHYESFCGVLTVDLCVCTS